ncbi:MAG: hypothetical protein ACK4IT_02740 [Thioalkalivibrionaceae bacterium]
MSALRFSPLTLVCAVAALRLEWFAAFRHMSPVASPRVWSLWPEPPTSIALERGEGADSEADLRLGGEFEEGVSERGGRGLEGDMPNPLCVD